MKCWERHVVTDQHKENAQIDHSKDVVALDIAYETRIIGYRIYNNNHQNLEYNVFLNSEHVTSNLISILSSYVKLHSAIKFQLYLYGNYVRKSDDPDEEELSKKKGNFNTKMTELLQSDTISSLFPKLFDDLMKQTDEFTTKGSGWALTNISYIEVHISKFAPLRGGTFIPLPSFLRSKHACINPKHNDNDCFKWAVRGYFRHEEKKNEYPFGLRSRPDIQKHIYREVAEMKPDIATKIDTDYSLDWGDIEFPIDIKRIKDFVDMNPTISITVYGVAPDNEKIIVGPLFRSAINKQNHIHLMFLEKEGCNHFCLISDLSRLVHSQLGGRQIHREICDDCLRTFNCHGDLNNHQENDCLKIITYLPEPGTVMEFQNFANAIKDPLICYADFESVLIPIQSCENSPESSSRKSQHVASSYAFLIKYEHDSSQDYFETYRQEEAGESCTSRFVNSLYSKLKSMYENLVLNNVKPMIFTAADKRLFDQQTHCHICKRPIRGKKVRDHDHQTGKFNGAACDECNKKYYLTKEVSVFFHNLSKYDAHLFIEDLAKLETNGNIKIIPSTDETYISFMKPIEIKKIRQTAVDETSHDKIFLKIRFKDSYRFFPGSLESQAANLSPSQYKNTEKFLSLDEHSSSLITKLKRKGVFPYEYIDSFDKYKETRLPPKEAFTSYDDENNKYEISDEDYQHALDVFHQAKCKTIGEYNDLYLKTDVLILADVFENFRSIAIQPDVYGLDPTHYYTLPGFSWDAMLKSTGVKLELLSDLKMVNFINNGIRGGLSQCSHRYAKANNKHVSSTFDPSKEESSYLIYLDVNNLYGWAMSYPLPENEFEWVPEDQLTSFDVNSISDNDYHGYILEVDLEYPEELHGAHNDLPFCPEPKKFGYTKKLCATLEFKTNYIIHYLYLKQALANGLVLKKIHKILKFHQSTWLKPYVAFNNNLRTLATTAAEKDLFKLMVNSIFGKAIENVRKRRNIYLCSDWESIGQRKGAESYIASG